ncbi:MAG: cell wall hydrolase [Rhodobacteraceae bacterium]|nr:cell wall hydrolase [Paracoccaceae bacterium]
MTDGATHFHTIDVSPYWASELVMTASIGRHLFYRGPQ